MCPSTSDADYLALDDAALLGECDVHVYKSSGPGGQHRNKVCSAVRLRHRPTGVSAHGDESRSQHENKRRALARLRMNLACRCRRPVDAAAGLPPVVAGCTFTPRGGAGKGRRRLRVGRRDGRFWPVAAYVLDVLSARGGRLADAADAIGISTANLTTFLKSERHLLAAAQKIRRQHGLKTLT